MMSGIIFLIVRHHEFLDVFLKPFSFKQKAVCHVQESSGKYLERGRSAVAKPRPMNLVSKNFLSVKKDLPQE